VIPIGTDEWFALWAESAPGIHPGPGPSGSVEITLTRDDDARTFTAYYTDGLMTSMAGPNADADLRVRVPEHVWVSISEGDRAPMERALLRGELRVTGVRERLRDLGAWVWSDEALALMAHVHTRTQY
jgi:hypothetical protein